MKKYEVVFPVNARASIIVTAEDSAAAEQIASQIVDLTVRSVDRGILDGSGVRLGEVEAVAYCEELDD